MQLFIVAVRDSAADSFHAPLFFPALGMAERWFRDEVRSPGESVIGKHPADYELHQFGSFDASAGEFVVGVPRLLLRGLDCVTAAPMVQ